MRVNIEIDDEIWRKVSVLAASTRKTKKAVVNKALKTYLETYVVRFPPAQEETGQSNGQSNILKKQKEDEENGNSG